MNMVSFEFYCLLHKSLNKNVLQKVTCVALKEFGQTQKIAKGVILSNKNP